MKMQYPAKRLRQITATCFSCSLGQLLIGATEQGICAVALLDCVQVVMPTLQSLGMAATGPLKPPFALACADALCKHMLGAHSTLEFPLDLDASPFQKLVWRALRSIEPGATCTYQNVAEMIFRPKAARAVASACAANPVCLLIPCHRVVPKGKLPGGYRWGQKRKKQLLALEGHFS